MVGDVVNAAIEPGAITNARKHCTFWHGVGLTIGVHRCERLDHFSDVHVRYLSSAHIIWGLKSRIVRLLSNSATHPVTEFDTRDTYKAYNGFVSESCVVEGIQHEATAEDAAELAKYVRGKLNLAFTLACQGEQERRSGHRASAEAYQRKWEETIAEVKRLLPLVRKSGVSLFPTAKPQPSRSRQKGR